jgi:hypothetical protein
LKITASSFQIKFNVDQTIRNADSYQHVAENQELEPPGLLEDVEGLADVPDVPCLEESGEDVFANRRTCQSFGIILESFFLESPELKKNFNPTWSRLL